MIENSPLDFRDHIIFSMNVHGSVFEWGGDQITKFYGKRYEDWTCVTYDREDFKDLSNEDSQTKFILREPDLPHKKYQPAEKGQFKTYVNSIHESNKKYDTIFIHGRDRVSCVYAAIDHLNEGGKIVIFDFWNRKRYHRILDDFEVVDGHNDNISGNTNTMVVLVPKPKNRKKLLIYSGYSSKPWNFSSLYSNAVGGSELATIRIASEFKMLGYDVVVGGAVREGVGTDGVRYISLGEDLQSYLNRNKLDVIIVSRYLHFFTHYKFQTDQLYLLMHDIVYLPWAVDKSVGGDWNSQAEVGDVIHENYAKGGHIDNFICLTDWHASYYAHVYPYTKDKIITWGNAIHPESFSDQNIEKVKDSFIWTSRAVRGLRTLLDIWPQIKERIPDATLNVYSYGRDGEEDVWERCQQLDGVTHHGGVPQSVLLQRIQESEFWFYTTNFSETYCITALEMQYSKVLCVSTRLAALINTVADRGILFDIPREGYDSEEYRKVALDSFFSVYDNPELKNELVEKAHEWAKKQTWRNRALELDTHFKEVARAKATKW